MRIAIIQPRTSYHIAGSEKISLKHAEFLSQLGHKIDLYTSKSKELEESFLFKEFIQKKLSNVNIIRFDVEDSVPGLYRQINDTEHVRWVTESLAFNEKIFEDLKKNATDIILSYYLPDSIFKPAEIPNVIYLSGYPSVSIPWYRSFIKFCDAAISISSTVTEKWSTELKEVSRVYSLGTGVDYPLPIIKKILTKSKYNLVFAGRLIERKGILTLIDAYREIASENKDIHLWILGGGELNDAIINKITALCLGKRITLTGVVNNPYDYFSIADICIFPSHSGDGLMGTVLESMAAGKSVITTINNGNEDVIKNDYNGILIEPKNVIQLKLAIIDLIGNPKKREILGKNAEKFIVEQVVWKKNVEKLSAILQDIIEKTS